MSDAVKLDHLKALTNRAEVVKVRTALNPILWLTAVVTVASLVAAVVSSDAIVQVTSLVLAGAPVLATIVAFFILLFRDPNRLQSEEFQLRQQELIILRKGDDAPMLVEQAEGLSQTESLERGEKRGEK